MTNGTGTTPARLAGDPLILYAVQEHLLAVHDDDSPVGPWRPWLMCALLGWTMERHEAATRSLIEAGLR